MSGGWIGVDLDGTLAHYDGWRGAAHIGAPVEPMVKRVLAWLEGGIEVRIFTARVWPLKDPISPDCGVSPIAVERMREGDTRRALQAALAIQLWCMQHLGRRLTITCVKDFAMIELWDDRAVQVHANQGHPVGFSTRGLA